VRRPERREPPWSSSDASIAPSNFRSFALTLGSFVQAERPEKGSAAERRAQMKVIFPRFHQWDAVRRLEAQAREHGAGQSYLVQHSAGSGKSNSIAWLAHRLSSLHDAADRPVFHEVVVITDRLVLDRQLQTFEGSGSLESGGGEVVAIFSGRGREHELEKEHLSRIVEVINERYGLELGEADQLLFDQFEETWAADETLAARARTNIFENVRLVFDRTVIDTVVRRMDRTTTSSSASSTSQGSSGRCSTTTPSGCTGGCVPRTTSSAWRRSSTEVLLCAGGDSRGRGVRRCVDAPCRLRRRAYLREQPSATTRRR
jgi:SWI2/SNF2 ATPase-like protein